MGFASDGRDRVNQFALVIYIPDPLGRFVNDLRLELAPSCRPHAHVSVLPPRPLGCPWQLACKEARALAEEFTPFEIEATGTAIFPLSKVIYLEIGNGARELHRMHERLTRANLAHDEPYPYHPHITLAQELPPEAVADAYELARRRWNAYMGPRSFTAERAAFVQNTADNHWLDLAGFSLSGVPAL